MSHGGWLRSSVQMLRNNALFVISKTQPSVVKLTHESFTYYLFHRDETQTKTTLWDLHCIREALVYTHDLVMIGSIVVETIPFGANRTDDWRHISVFEHLIHNVGRQFAAGMSCECFQILLERRRHVD